MGGAMAAHENAVTTKSYVDTAVNTKQEKLDGTSGYAVTYGATTGTTGGQQIVTTLSGAADNTIPTTGAVATGVNSKQIKFDGTPNTVVTYTSTAGTTSETPVYDETLAYSNQTTALAEAGHVNTAVQNAFNAHITCHTYASGATQTPENCELWQVNNLSGTYVPETPSGN